MCHVKIEGQKFKLLVSSSIKSDLILSWEDLVRLGVLPAEFPRLPTKQKVATISINPVPSKNISPTSNGLSADFLSKLEALKVEFKDILTDTLPPQPMKGQDMTIELDTSREIRPKKVHTCKKLPIHWEVEAQKLIDQLVSDGVIEKVTEETSDWVSPAFFVPKSGNKLRLVTDFTHLNKYVKRPVHPFPSATEIVQRIPKGAKFFAKLDALQGYHQVPLAPESRHLTTFLLPMGKFRYKRGPMGLRSTNDVYCAKSDKTIEDVEDAQKIVDDILLPACTEDVLLSQIRQVLTNCRRFNVAISLKKLEVGTNINFAGFSLSPAGLLPDSDKIKALSDFPMPSNLTNLRSFLGLANQLGGFIENLASKTAPLRGLLKKGVSFTWTTDHTNAFLSLRRELASPSLISYFDPSLETVLLSDASCLHGLGFALMQYSDEGVAKLVQCGSRSLSSAETRYAPIELECLGIAWAVEKCSHFLLGHPKFTVITDHQPLRGIFQKDLSEIINKRLQRFRERLMPYVFDLNWKAGKLNLIADAFSRSPVSSADLFQGEDHSIRTIASFDSPLKECLYEASSHSDYKAVLNLIIDRKDPADLHPNHPCQQYASIWHSLSLSLDKRFIVYNGSKILVPNQARHSVLSFLHKGHCGFSKTKLLLQDLYFWPGMVTDLKNLISNCDKCATFSPSQRAEPLILTAGKFPFERVGIDLFFAHGSNYLLLIDSFSGFPFVAKLNSLTSSSICKQLLRWFWDFGFPKFVRTDGGPQFRSEFNSFCSAHSIQRELSSPYNPSSNGLAESGVKQMKYLTLKCSSETSFREALLVWRNTPRADGYSPAQLFFGFTLNFGQSPDFSPSYINRPSAALTRSASLFSAKSTFDRTSVKRPPLQVGDRVRVQDPKTNRWTIKGVILSIREDGRSYSVQCDDSSAILRNRRFIRPRPH